MVIGEIDTFLTAEAANPSTAREPLTPPRHEHGYLPTHPKMFTSLVLSGRGVKSGVTIGHVRSLDVAPTIARLLGLEMKDVEGRVLTEALRRTTDRYGAWMRLQTRAERTAACPVNFVPKPESGVRSRSYSVLSATIGSTRIARSAGSRLATSATTVRITGTPMNVAGSRGCIFVQQAAHHAARQRAPRPGPWPRPPAPGPTRAPARAARSRAARRRSRRGCRSRASAGSRGTTARRRCRRPPASAPSTANNPSSQPVKRGAAMAPPTTSVIGRTPAIGSVGSICATS